MRQSVIEPAATPRGAHPTDASSRWPTRTWHRLPAVSAPLAREVAVAALQCLALFLVLRTFVQSVRIDGESMAPTLHSGQHLLINKAAYWRRDAHAFLFGGPRRGDVVVFEAPMFEAASDEGTNLVKRIIGLPGDTIVIRNGEVFVNGRRQDEPQVKFHDSSTYPADGQPMTIPESSFLVLGDNRPGSADSRLGWLVPVDNLIGKAWVSYWPPGTWGLVPELLAQLAPGDSVAPAREPSPIAERNPATTSTAGRVLFDQRFGVLPGWPNDTHGNAWFSNDGYHLFAREPGRFVAIGAPLGTPLRNAILRATFRKMGGPPGGGYGLVVRDQEGTGPRDGVNQDGRYYVLEVGDRREVGIWRRAGDHWIDLKPWTHADAVLQDTSNELEVRSVGERLTLIVNGVEVASVTDAALAEGTVGIFAGGDGNQVLLERFSVTQID